ncbi:TonB-dependent hemoglobin/transferrin/lactoferrin family receptor [Methylocapsa sp. S129]|uniref:TonB-dependent hemoglobin/transferrin/lactoferrin family receptor n=1 Tax=Methylocapsa sp. S129 TaxID=1641869 RepID=UPI00131DF580|nr:TonB-dependent hemoglobin/transferrin/lactoferrin family receptor [Methylocapsa sp. S129]
MSSSAVLAALALSVGAASAQQAGSLAASAPAQGGVDVNLDTITVTATKTEESVVDTMAGASVVTGKQIKQQQPGSISEMLQNVPGVAAQVTPNDPGQSINIRGMQDFGRVNVLVDGARQDYQISGHNANGTFYLDPEFVGQADVVRGPVSNIYGSGAIGGVVSFRTRDINDLLKPDENYGVQEHVVVGTNGAGVVTSTSAGARIGTAADIYGQLIYRNADSFQDGVGDTAPDTGSQLLGGLLKLNVRPSDGQQISATALTQNNRFTNDGTSTAGPRFDNNVTTGTYTLGYKFASPDTPLIDFDSKIYYSTTQNRQTFVAPDALGVYSALGVMPGDALDDKVDTYGFDIHNTSRFSTGAVNHALTIGGDGVLDNVHTFDDAGGYVAALTPSGRRTLSGAFIQDEMSYGGWLRVLGAIRYDDYQLHGGDVESSGEHVSPKLTIGVTPIKGLEFYGTYAEGYRAPSVTETLIEGVHPFPAFDILPNSTLRPETAHNLEAGVNLKYDDVFKSGDSFRGKITAFTNRVDDYIDIEPVGSPYLVPFIPGAPASLCGAEPFLCFPITSYQYVNVAKARLQGVELEGAYDWGRGFLSVAGSAIDGKNLVDGLALATVPPYRASTTLGFRFLNDNSLTVGGRFTLVGASAKNVPIAADSDGTTPLPSAAYGLVDLFASYAYNDRVSGDLSITNLFNKQYTQFLDVEPNAGITVKAGLTIKFASK